MFDYLSSINETDKFRGGLYKEARAGHNYQLIYENILSADLDKILEIGTSSCGFGKFLRDNQIGKYLVGADLKKCFVSNHIPSNQIWLDVFDDFYEGNVAQPQFIEWINNHNYKFDLVIDDASHEVSLQQHLISNCESFLSERGIFVTEDIVSFSVARQLFDHIPNRLKPLSYIVDLSLSVGRSDDICIIIDKRYM